MFRTVLLASPRSFCAGVERAIAVVEHLLQARGGPIYVRKQIVHNTHVMAELEVCGAVFVDELVGSANSSNSLRLVELARRQGIPSYPLAARRP